MKRVCSVLLFVALFGCDESEDALECWEDPDVDCCELDPELPECEPEPSCEDAPERASCLALCEDDPSLSHCVTLCESNDLAFCPATCEEDELQARCVPPPLSTPDGVSVVRDTMGIAHITADTEEGAFWASGYVQALDRLGQMDIVRREALGRQAEVFGERKIERDQLMRSVGIARLSERAVDTARTAQPENHALLVAWTQGVNARIQEVLDGTAPTPPSMAELGYDPEPWAIMDGAATGKLLLFGSSNQIENDLLATIIRQYLPDVWDTVPLTIALSDAYSVPESERPTAMRLSSPPSALPRAPRALPADFTERLRRMREILGTTDFEGSNNWAVAGEHTFNGRPLLAGDPHQGLAVPSRFYAQHIRGGRFNVAGWAFVGAPGIILGHNDRIAWTATLNYPDMMDLWDVTLDAEASTVELGGLVRSARRRVETIEVAGAVAVEYSVFEVPGRGVILPEGIAPLAVGRPGTRLLFNWTGFEPTDDIGMVVALNTASSVDAFEAAADRAGIGAFNWVAADASDISYISSMWVPMRPALTPETVPFALLDGRDPSTLWTGDLVPRAMLPRSRGADQGYVGTANNDPFGFTDDGDLTNDAYYFGAFYDPGTRAQRVYDELERLIAAPEPITVEHMETLQTDSYSLLAERLLPIFEDAWSRLDTDPDLSEFRGRAELTTLHDLLVAWDRRMERDRAAPVVFTGLLYFFAEAAIEDELTLAFTAILDAEPVYVLKFPILAAEGGWPGSEALFQQGVPRAMFEALSRTDQWLTNVVGITDPNTATWADFHCTRFGAREGIEAWDVVPCTPTDGGDGTVNVSSANLITDSGARDAHRSGGGAIYRMVVSFADDGTPEAVVNFPPGNVEDPSSPFWSNTLEDWVEDRYAPLPFRAEDLTGLDGVPLP